ncbi:YhgN family NAAT transporter [Catenovulum sp. SM1970]|uniref:YhgN family NAAT transporter n=1 Tax=Marinifaba aquimaris TaxID=2741323 RepID=UPI0015736CEC|nr:YhgN family NAAT transporter [Marinifaba aquimaris]NTS77792.1 YhgN family NAAT transporter [Marinifaba aquimaris]
MEILSAALIFFLIMDPLGNIPIVISCLKDIEERRRYKILIRELLISLLLMMAFLLWGQNILDFLHLKQETVGVSGGIILFIIALRMIFPSRHGGSITGLKKGEEPFIVPLAVPMIAGPSILASVILLTNQQPDRVLDWGIALFIAWLASSIILMAAPFLQRVLGDKGTAATERLMGMILIMIAVQMLMDGVKNFFAT